MLLNLLVATALAVVFVRDLFAVVMLFGIYSLLSASFFLNLDAPDVALTEAAIGAGVAPVLMLSTLALVTVRKARRAAKPRHSALLPLMAVLITGAALVYGTLDMPHFGDPNAPAQQHVAERYIVDSQHEIDVPNMVTAVLASYRGFDTLGEVFVIFTAGIGVLGLLGTLARRRRGAENRIDMQRHLVLRVIARILIPLILIYGLYIQFHGEYGPGGGFQAGVIFAAAFILFSMVYGLDKARALIPPRFLVWMMVFGTLLFAGVGVVSMLLGGNFLDYNLLSYDPVHGQHLGILLIEFGVGVCVAAVMVLAFFSFSALKFLPGAASAEEGK